MALPYKGIEWHFYVTLVDNANPPEFKVDPTIATGDFKISQDGGAFVNLDANPVTTPSGSIAVKVNLTADEMDADEINIQGKDIAGDEWQEIFYTIGDQMGVADVVWDEVLTGATHNVKNSSGRRLRGLQEFQGYQNGSVWIDTVNGVSGVDLFENGTVENPVDNMDDANTIAAGVGLSQFAVYSGSSITLSAAQNNQVFKGINWTLDINGQDITGSAFEGAEVSGITAGIGTKQTFIFCVMGNVTHRKNTHMLGCGIAGTQIVGEAGDYFLLRCYSEIAGDVTWVFDFGDAIGDTNFNMRAYSGGVQIESMGDTGTDTASIEGWGQIIEGTCSGGAATIRGNFTVTGITNITLTDLARIDQDSVSDTVWEHSEASSRTMINSRNPNL